MKVALVHDWLNTKLGGGEKLFMEIAELYPEAPVYTLIYNESLYTNLIDPARVRTSFLQRWPNFLKNRPRYLLPLIPIAVEQFDFSSYDLVISSSTAWAKSIITRPETLHLCYCHSPMRFVWDHWPGYLDEQHVGPVRRGAIRIMTSQLRLWDYYSSARVDHWLANSQTTAGRITKYYQQPSEIIYPPADTKAFKPVPAGQKEDYYVTLGNLTPYKKFDLAIVACNSLKRRLVVIGEGSDMDRLSKLAGSTVKFVGRLSDGLRAETLARARGFIFPNEEDLGIVAIEAQASGTPVIAYGRGGGTETIIEGKTGHFFHEPTTESLARAITEFEKMKFETKALVSQAAQFDRQVFRNQFKAATERAMEEHRTQYASKPL
jgi:glycosyltransferase involved in cell wall biosynthesis